MSKDRLNVLVLAGGPDRERDVSLKSGQEVARALQEAGHSVTLRDITPENLAPLDEFAQLNCDVIFPVLHGKWGEGGGLQHLLDQRNLPYVGCCGAAAELCIDKHRTKLVLAAHSLPTPAFELVTVGQPLSIHLPVVVKPVDEGSSFGMAICHDAQQLHQARTRLRDNYPKLLVEQFVAGKEITVGIVGQAASQGNNEYQVLPPIQIVPATEFYDYQAKYDRDDTRYLFDIDLPPAVLTQIKSLALAAHHALGVRHLSRVDFIVDADNQPWILEINTIPGFTSHSLLPMAARQAGIEMPTLVDRLVRLALRK